MFPYKVKSHVKSYKASGSLAVFYQPPLLTPCKFELYPTYRINQLLTVWIVVGAGDRGPVAGKLTITNQQMSYHSETKKREGMPL